MNIPRCSPGRGRGPVSSEFPGGASFDSGELGRDDRIEFVPGVAGTWEYVDQVSGATGTLTAQ